MTDVPTATAPYETLIRKAWSDPAFREALRANPRATVERELRTTLPEGVEIEVVEETPTKLYLVVPAPPPQAEGQELSDEELGKVAGGTMMGAPWAKLSLTCAGSGGLITTGGRLSIACNTGF